MRINIKAITLILFIVFLTIIGLSLVYNYTSSNDSIGENPATISSIPDAYNQAFRPQYHFTPQSNWMNDPNGMVYYNGEYHLFYQHNPHGSQFGNMSWGHAVSEDLVHWEELDVALQPDEHGMIFSGSVIADETNESGLFPTDEGGLVAFYTSAGDTQDQRIAYSTDEGRTWTKYEGNPVVPNPGIVDFRDPKVIWHEASSQFVMLLAAGNKIMFYGSKNLRDWDYLSEYGQDVGAHGGVWETPELFQLPVDGNTKNEKWVLQVDMNPGSIAGGSGGQYFLGEFNGKEFIRDEKDQGINWVDYGKDFYAAQLFNGAERPIWMAWMSNWEYASAIPTHPFRGAMSMPRTLSLQTDQSGEVQLVQQPVEEMKDLRMEPVYEMADKTISEPVQLSSFDRQTYEVVAEFKVGTAREFGFRVRQGTETGEQTVVGYDAENGYMFTDRQYSGVTDFHPSFSGVYRAPTKIKENGTVTMRIFVDRSSVELFANGGEEVLTNRIFPSLTSKDLQIYAVDGEVNVESLKIYPIESSWKTS